jgi:rRNA small subunit pseudouridine methyltransferase Nep1
MLLDSPLNKAGLLQVYIHTEKNVLIEVNPQTRIPRLFSRFSGLMGERISRCHLTLLLTHTICRLHTYLSAKLSAVQLLHDLSISAKGSEGVKLLKVIKNPVTDYLPTGCLKIGLLP